MKMDKLIRLLLLMFFKHVCLLRYELLYPEKYVVWVHAIPFYDYDIPLPFRFSRTVRPFYVPIYDEVHRLETFYSCGQIHILHVSFKDLARNGFYCLGGREIRCCYCDRRFPIHSASRDVREIHHQLDPTCPMVRGSQERSLRASSTDPGGSSSSSCMANRPDDTRRVPPQISPRVPAEVPPGISPQVSPRITETSSSHTPRIIALPVTRGESNRLYFEITDVSHDYVVLKVKDRENSNTLLIKLAYGKREHINFNGFRLSFF